MIQSRLVTNACIAIENLVRHIMDLWEHDPISLTRLATQHPAETWNDAFDEARRRRAWQLRHAAVPAAPGPQLSLIAS